MKNGKMGEKISHKVAKRDVWDCYDTLQIVTNQYTFAETAINFREIEKFRWQNDWRSLNNSQSGKL
jgi:hypothetical protein